MIIIKMNRKMNIIILVMTMTIMTLTVMKIMMMTKILAITYIITMFTMVEDQENDGYEKGDDEDFDKGL